jgi:hypothetical protein
MGMLILVAICCWFLCGLVVFVEMLNKEIPLLRWKSVLVIILAGPVVWLICLVFLFFLLFFASIDKTIEWIKK